MILQGIAGRFMTHRHSDTSCDGQAQKSFSFVEQYKYQHLHGENSNVNVPSCIGGVSWRTTIIKLMRA